MKLWFERGAWASKRGRLKIEGIAPDEIREIAVIRHAALGDMVLVRPFLLELRRLFPRAKIVLSIVSNYSYGVPVDLVDRVHVLPGNDQRKISLKQQIKRARELGSPDILFDLADTTRSRYLCFLSRANIKIGFPYRWYLRNLLLDAAVLRSDFTFEADALLDCLRLLGLKRDFSIDYGWPSPLQKSSKSISDIKIIYFPFASTSSKCYPKQAFLDLIAEIGKKWSNIQSVLLGGILLHENLNDWKGPCSHLENVSLVQAISLEDTQKLILSATIVVSNDTGIRNLAISLGIPTVGIFFSTVPYRYLPRTGLHTAVFCSDGSIPLVADVVKCVQDVLERVPGASKFL